MTAIVFPRIGRLNIASRSLLQVLASRFQAQAQAQAQAPTRLLSNQTDPYFAAFPGLHSSHPASASYTSVASSSTCWPHRRHLTTCSFPRSCDSNAEGELETLGPYDLLIVGAGPAGLAAAIRAKQLNPDAQVCVLEKAAEVGAHILSGNVFESYPLDTLLPGWKTEIQSGTGPYQCHVKLTPVEKDEFVLLTEKRKWTLPTPPSMYNEGNYIISLSQIVRYLAAKAEELGVEIYSGFPAAQPLLDDNNTIIGVVTGDFGIAKDGSKKDTYQRGVAVRANYTLLAEGARGSLTKVIEAMFNLRNDCQPQTYAIGLKEVWRIKPENHKPGHVLHSIGYPMDLNTYGGSFIYHLSEDNMVAVGYVVALDYKNPYLSPYQEFQRFKSHPAIRPLLEGGTVVQYGARTLNEGGIQCIPRLYFPGGAIVGCAAGFLNVAKIKGTHLAIKSGIMAAETAHSLPNKEAVAESPSKSVDPLAFQAYENAIKNSSVWNELHQIRNLRPAFKWGLVPFLAYSALEAYLFKGRVPWTIAHDHTDHEATGKAQQYKPIDYPKPDNKVTFDILTSVALSGTNHNHDSPSHLKLKDATTPENINLPIYAAPESRYCPAKVYEYIDGKLNINAQNCLHCKACDIKDPTQNIQWTVPEGGGGPKYTIM